MALVNMYDATGKTKLSEEELPLCHNLQATAKNFITRSSANKLPDNALDDSGATHNSISSNFGLFENEELHISDELVVMQLPMPNLELLGLSANFTGCLSEGPALLEALDPGAWDSHPNHASAVGESSSPHVQAVPRLKHHPSTCYPITTPLLGTLPLPSSHAYLEPTFSRRLVRLLWEYAFKVLTHADIPPTQVNRCFGFCLRSRTKNTLIRKFTAYLGLSSGSISEHDRQVWNAAPDVRDSMEGGSDEWDCWIEAGKVEMYLESLGFSLAEHCDEGTLKNKPAGIPGCFGQSTTSPQTIRDDIQILQRAPSVPYGSKWQPNSCITDTLFDDDGNFQVPASWLMPDAVDTAESLVTPNKCPAHLNAERFMQPRSECYLDVDLFFAGTDL